MAIVCPAVYVGRAKCTRVVLVALLPQSTVDTTSVSVRKGDDEITTAKRPT